MTSPASNMDYTTSFSDCQGATVDNDYFTET